MNPKLPMVEETEVLPEIPDEMPPVAAMPVMEDEVSLEALSQPDEREAMTPPAVGDKVSYTKEGTVSRIVDGTAYVTVTHVNGQEVKPESAREAVLDEGEALEKEAAAMSEQPLY